MNIIFKKIVPVLLLVRRLLDRLPVAHVHRLRHGARRHAQRPVGHSGQSSLGLVEFEPSRSSKL